MTNGTFVSGSIFILSLSRRLSLPHWTPSANGPSPTASLSMTTSSASPFANALPFVLSGRHLSLGVLAPLAATTGVGPLSSNTPANCSIDTPPGVAPASKVWPAPDSNARNHTPPSNTRYLFDFALTSGRKFSKSFAAWGEVHRDRWTVQCFQL